MTTIDSSVRTPTYQPAPADGKATPSGEAARQHALQASMATPSVADAQAEAVRVLASTGAGPATGVGSTPLQTIAPQATTQLLGELPDLESNLSVDIYAITAMMRKTHQEMATAAREVRSLELNAQFGELMAGADDMKKAADLRMVAGITQGAIQATAGAVQLGASMKAASQSSKAMAAEGSSPESVAQANVGAANTSAQGDAIGKMLTGIGEMTSAVVKHEADLADVDAKRHEANAKLHEAGYSQANDKINKEKETLADIKETLKDLDNAVTESNRAIARNI